MAERQAGILVKLVNPAAVKQHDGLKYSDDQQREGRQSVFVGPAFSEAAHFAVRYAPLAQRFYERKKARTNGIIALRAVARKLARATGRCC